MARARRGPPGTGPRSGTRPSRASPHRANQRAHQTNRGNSAHHFKLTVPGAAATALGAPVPRARATPHWIRTAGPPHHRGLVVVASLQPGRVFGVVLVPTHPDHFSWFLHARVRHGRALALRRGGILTHR